MRLSKSKIMSGRQCERRLWLEVHRPELLEYGEETQRAFAFGHRLNDAARALEPGGMLISHAEEPSLALSETRAALRRPGSVVLFEPAFAHGGIFVRADILRRRKRRHHLTEVKASTEVKELHPFDCAIQAHVIEGDGCALGSIELAHVNNEFVYQGDGDYRGLFRTTDIEPEARPLIRDVPKLAEALRKALAGAEPNVRPGAQCEDPYPCPFIEHCEPGEFPVRDLPGSSAQVEALRAKGYADLRQIPERLVSGAKARRAWEAARSGRVFLDPELGAIFRKLGYPRYYLDFETISFVVPIWKDTRPYEQLPFQWSLHVESRAGRLAHREFLDTTGEPPMHALACALLEAVGPDGPVRSYGSFEKTVLRGLAERYPRLGARLLALADRIVDLLPLFRRCYYHPQMRGSWSLKEVLPAVVPEVGYSGLGEVTDGTAAQQAYMEIIDPATDAARKQKLAADLREYCKRDTLGLRLLVDRLSK